jgi:hypothetical protein
MKTIYISGKVTGKEDQAFKEFQDAEILLDMFDYKVINPMKLKHNHDKSWESYMKVCLKALLKCDCIYMLEGYEHSRGAMLELYIAQSIGIEVHYQTRKKAVKKILWQKIIGVFSK